VDDEQPSLDKLVKLLAESGKIDLKGKFIEPLEALKFLHKVQIDAVFLDIEMPDMDGMELANQVLDLQGKIAVVFVTAYNEYAVEAFRINALDYLMKPVSKERLNETLNRIIDEKSIVIDRAELRVQCFVKFKVATKSGEVKFRTSKAEELLAFLIDHLGAAVTRTEIIDQLWDEYDGDRAITHFNTTLHYVKKALLQHGVDNPIKHDRGTYQFDIQQIDCDYCRFKSFVSAPAQINDLSITEYEKGIQLYTGNYLAANEYPWSEGNRAALKEKYITMLLAMVDYYNSIGEYCKTIKLIKNGLKQEPLHREMYYRLIEALILVNDRITAYKYYDSYKRKLKSNLGIEPDVGLKKLIR